MSTTLSYRSIKRRAITTLTILVAVVALVMMTGCTPPDLDEPAPKPTIALEDVDPKDDAAVQAWIDYYVEIGEVPPEDLDVMREVTDHLVKWAMSPQDCRSRIATSVVEQAVRQDIAEDDDKVTFAILVATNHARCWEMKDYDLP